MRRIFAIVIVCVIAMPCLKAQNLFTRLQHRASAAQSRQPSWSVPLNQPYPMLIQVFRFDTARQITPAHADNWNFGVSKGLNIVPGFNSEFDFYPPSYLMHNSGAKDGFGDPMFGYKYRIASGNEAHGNYAIAAQLTATIPTGSYSNGSADAVLGPTFEAGKGWGRFDIISCVGGSLPTGDTAKLGRVIAWNTTAQYKVHKYFFPEIESNATYFFGGKNDGKTQNFLEPGLTTAKFKVRPGNETSRTGFAFGAGIQIATSSFHTYNHQLVFTSRFIF
ncbi:MAG: transporter [Acidobacteriaceae bacterium]